jgi:putative hemolysin
MVLLVLVLANGLFAGAEVAVVGIDRVRLSQLRVQGGRRAGAIQALRTHPEPFLATVQIVITVVGTAAGAFGGATFARNLEPALTPVFGTHSGDVAIGVVIVLVSFLSLVLGELVPKSLGLRYAEPYALLMAPVLLGLSSIARPIVWLLTRSSNVVLKGFGDKTTFSETRLSPEELRHLVEEAAESGTLDARAGDIAARAIDFAALTAAHAMIPRTRVVGLRRNAATEELRRIVLEHEYSRLPVYDGDLDHIVGYVLYKDLVPLAWEGRLLVLEDLIRPPYVVHETMSATALLHEMRERRTQLAFVVDEQGGTSGIVTFDDLVEELVGEVFGERHGSTPPSIQMQIDGSVLVAADASIRDVNRELGLELPQGETWSTVGGFCLHLADGVPQQGTELLAPDGTKLLIERATDRAIQQIRVIPRA